MQGLIRGLRIWGWWLDGWFGVQDFRGFRGSGLRGLACRGCVTLRYKAVSRIIGLLRALFRAALGKLGQASFVYKGLGATCSAREFRAPASLRLRV